MRDPARLELIRNAHRQRKESSTSRMEDYLEVIYELVMFKGYVTSTDISTYLNVSMPSVTKMMRRLDREGYLDYERYRGVRLTKHGMSVAKAIHRRHTVLSQFLEMLGVSKEIANSDAEGIEHHLHAITVNKLAEFVKCMKTKRTAPTSYQ